MKTLSTRTWQRVSAIFLALVLILVSIAQNNIPAQAAPQAAAPSSERTVFVHLFEWKWADIARECETFLGPKGFAAVQVSPPNEHAKITDPAYPWWQRYQPVSYTISSRSGDRDAFANMVSRCRAVGVEVYADVVINHMAGGDGTSILGNSYTKYNYPGLYSSNDFHWYAPSPDGCQAKITDYQNHWHVQHCELENLSDLRTETAYVRGKIADYLVDLHNLGVRGYRIDAAKHMWKDDIKAILDNVNARVDPDPFIVQEVIDPGGEAVSKSEYYQNGDVNEFLYGKKLGEKFLNIDGQKISQLSTFGETWGLAPSNKAVVFVDNHDKQRGHGGGGTYVTFKNGSLYDLTNVFMLAWPYGYPQLMSSYAWETDWQGPPSDGNGNTNTIYNNGENNPPDCFDEWKCEHRWRPIANMVAFHNVANANPNVTNWWDNGGNQIAFGRGDRGFVVINRDGSQPVNRTFQTSMAAGTYCNIIAGDFDAAAGTCSGPTITVNASGQAVISVSAMSAAAIHAGAKLPSGPTATPTATATSGPSVAVTFNVNTTTNSGENVFVVGSIPALGSWNTANAIALSSANYPVWSGTVNLPANTTVEYKYIKKNGSTVTWEGNANRIFTTPASGSVTRNDTWGTLATATPSGPTLTPAPTATPTNTATPAPGVSVLFNENASTSWGQNVYIVGNVAALGSWNPNNAVLMSSASYPVWKVTINLPANTLIQYKYIKKDGSGNVIWESDPNRSFTTPGSGSVTRNDTWR